MHGGRRFSSHNSAQFAGGAEACRFCLSNLLSATTGCGGVFSLNELLRDNN